MRRILTIGLGTLCLMTFMTTQAFALVVAPESCETDADCQDGFECLIACTGTSEEGSESSCEGTCEPKSNKNDCETDSDCPKGFECIEHTSWGVTTSSDEGPSSTEAPCREGEDCGDSAKEEPDSGAPPEPTETEETVKTCAPKACDVDADCEGGLVCVLETYGCLEAPTVEMAPMPEPDCPEGEDCGGDPSEEEPQEPTEPKDDCEPETVGYCAPKWLAPCEADTDCGPGFNCIEDEVCWATSGGSMGSSGGAPAEAPCDPDDEDCGGQDSGGGEGFAPEPEEDKDMPEEGCEPTGEFYCELQIIDCSTEACPEGMVCISAPPEATMVEDCAASSDGEMDCEESEPEESFPSQVCVPEGFEDWVGAGSTGVNSGSTLNTEDGDGNTNDLESPSDDEGTSGSSSSGGSSDSGCAGGGSDAPVGALVLSMLVLGLITRRRA